MGLKSKKNQFVLRLEYNGTILYEVNAQNISGEITIGRDSSCTWLLPTTDRSVSSHHAVIVVRRKNVYIEDTKSRNGIYFNGEKISSHRLAVGDQIAIGECKLFVERPSEQLKNVSKNNQLELLNGAKKGVISDLDKEIFRIGSAPDCDLVFTDNVISHVHAQIEQKKDGSCWIQDCGSRNGTKVNGIALSGDRNDGGRLLQDGDIITISYLELRFLDKHFVHVRTHLIAKIVAVVLTVGIVLGGYFFIRLVAPSSKKHIDFARSYAEKCEFQKARAHLEQARDAWGAIIYKEERLELGRRIDQWENTLKVWGDVQKMLSERKWSEANDKLRPLISDDMELWRWNNTDANESKLLALMCNRLIETYLKARSILKDSDFETKRMIAVIKELDHVLKETSSGMPDYLKPLSASAKDIRDELNLVCEELEIIRKLLDRQNHVEYLEDTKSNLSKLRKASEERAKHRKAAKKPISVKTQSLCNDLLTPFEILEEAKKCLMANYIAAASLEREAMVKNLEMLSRKELELCLKRFPVLFDIKKELETRNTNCYKTAETLIGYVENLKENKLVPGNKPDCIKTVFDKKTLDKVLQCDTLDLPAIQQNRSNPSGEYDRVLGVEVFYNYLRALPEPFDRSLLKMTPFEPELIRAVHAFELLADFMNFAGLDEMKEIITVEHEKNKVGDIILYADDLLQQRNDLIENMLEQYEEKKKDRKSIIAGMIAMLLGRDTDRLPEKLPEEIAEWFETQIGKIQEITDLPTDEAEKKAPELFKIAFPGEPLLEEYWLKRDAAGKQN